MLHTTLPQDVLDLLEGRHGILDLLDEQCKFPTSTGKDLAQKLYTANVCKDSKRFAKPKLSVTAFTIDHYAGDVTYESQNFLVCGGVGEGAAWREHEDGQACRLRRGVVHTPAPACGLAGRHYVLTLIAPVHSLFPPLGQEQGLCGC